MTNVTDQQRVAAELELLCVAGAKLHKDSPRSTRAFGDDRLRMRTWENIIEEYLHAQPKVAAGGRLVVVTAGAPGVGKSSKVKEAVAELSGSLEHRIIDPDRIKDLIIERALIAGIYEEFLQEKLSDGLPIRPRELAGLTHEESMLIARRLRRLCMSRGENIIIEGTLSFAGMINEHLREVTFNGYDVLDVVSVEVPQEVARQRVLDRWWEGRNDQASLLGGRFVPQAVVDACWTPDHKSKCLANAQELHRRALRQEKLVTNLREVVGDGDATADGIAEVLRFTGQGGQSAS